jgi:ketosteroid isomerase-like protein
MKCHAVAAIAIVLSVGASACSSASGPQTGAAGSPSNSAPTVAATRETEDVAGIIVRNEKDWVAAIGKKDVATLDRLLADDFVGTSPTAHTYTKSNAIDDLKSGKYVVESMVMDDVSVNVYGNAAVSFASQEEKSRYAGADTSGHYHYTDVWVKKDGRWQAVASHGTRYEKPAANEKAE